MDAVALAQAGVPEVVAPLGTAITEDQLEALWRVVPEPLVALDGDRAGLDAAQRLIDLALPRLVAGRSLRFVLMPAGEDPDDVVRAGGRAAFEALVEASQPIVELLWRRETEGVSLDSPERRAALDVRLKAHLARIRDEGLRAHTWAALRERRAALFARPAAAHPTPHPGAQPARNGFTHGRGRGVGRPHGRVPVAASAAAKASFLGRAREGLAVEARVRESAILLGLINHPDLAPTFEERLDRMSFLCPDLGAMRDALISCLAEPVPAGPPASLADRLSARMGRDPRNQLSALGQLRDNPHLGPDADTATAARAIEAEISRHAAWMDKETEVRDAAEALTGEADEGLTWRLRQAADAHHRADREALPDEAGTEGSSDGELSRRLQDLIDRQIWKKPRKG
jgi:DNA primase